MPLFPTTNGTSHDVSAKRFMLITNPRTCSNLLVRILGLDKQPSTKHGQYHFLDCLLYLCTENLMEVDPADWTEEQRAKVYDLYKTRIEALEKTATPDDKDTRIIFTKEHVETILEPTTLTQYGQGNTTSNASPMRWGPGDSTRSPSNQTIFSDAYLDTWTPIFLVRHPARAFESIYRSFVDVMQTPMAAGTSEKSREVNTRVHMSLSWTRTLYEFYFSRGVQPVLIDADDLVLHTKPLTQRLAKFVGFDPDALQYTWQEATEAELSAKPAHMKRMLSSLDSSAGVKADQSKLSASFNVQKQLPRWTEEFGEQGAKDLRRWIEEAMPDYEFLHERRLRP